MEKEKSPIIELLSWLAILGNILFVLWILYNGVNESFQRTLIEKISYISLISERPLLAESSQKLRLVGQEVLYYPSLLTQVSSSSERYALSIGMNT